MAELARASTQCCLPGFVRWLVTRRASREVSGPMTDTARLAASPRPWGLPAGYQRWRRLLFVHWPVRPAVLRPLVPASLSIDEYQGSAYVSLVPFAVEAARPLGVPASFGLAFLETNVRTYVHLDGTEPGVYFFSLDAASLVATVGARIGLGLPYFWATGRERLGDDRDIAYRLRRCAYPGAHCRVRYQVQAYRGPAAPGSLDDFLIERYVLHVQRGPSLWSVRVQHRPYPLYDVQLREFEDTLVRAAGIAGLGAPSLVHFASGVDVEIFPPHLRPILVGRGGGPSR